MSSYFSSPATDTASSSLTGRVQYDVFISFRGKDVRRGFLSHLLRALESKKIKTFLDVDLQGGKDITTSLFEIIEKSDLSVVIFSKEYPKSNWCMEELMKIHESIGKRGHKAVPVFYEIDPTDVQELKRNYAVPFWNWKWRKALKSISTFPGNDSNNYQTDAELSDGIVDKVYEVLCSICPRVSHIEGLFGIDSSIKDVEALLQFDSKNDVRMVGIWGMGGIGKTTIASEVFHRNKKEFDGHCFISSVRENLSTRDGLITLRNKIICDLLGGKDLKIDSTNSVDEPIRRRLGRVNVLLVLDDVLNCMQLKSLFESSGFISRDSICEGSRIIVTSRDSHVLSNVRLKSDIYEVKLLKDIEALQLFSWHAFGENNPHQGYEELSEKVVRYASGIPLALVVLGSELKRKTTTYWEEALAKFSTTSPVGIQEILRISITEWIEPEERKIFLDIACFLKGFKRDYVENMLDTFGFHARVGIERLLEKSLLKEEREDKRVIITMHDLLEQMGREVVAEEKESKGHQSRLWAFDDIKDALTNHRGTKNVEAISLQPPYGDRFDINPEAFREMCKLRLLKFKFHFYSTQRVICPKGLEFLPNSLKYLYWDNFEENYWPSNYNYEKLVELHLKGSKFKKFTWTKPFVSLKLICLRGSVNLIEMSDWGMTPNLEVVDLGKCNRLVEIGTSLKTLNKLTKLILDKCKSLSRLPELPHSIKEIELSWSGLRQLPSTVWGLTHLKKLSLRFCEELEILPCGISSLVSLEVTSLNNCSKLVEIGPSLENLKKHTRLAVSDCTSLSSLPEHPNSIEELYLSGSGLKQLPSTIGHLTRLKEIRLAKCEKLESLPSSVCNLTSLETLDLSYCCTLQKLPEDFGNLGSLKELDASKSGLRELPLSIQNLSKLIKLDLTGCNELQSVPALPPNLEEFCARLCNSLFNEVKSSIVEQFRKKFHDQPTQIHKLFADGIQVPEWIKYHNDHGNSVSLDLENFGHSVSFVFSAVILPYSTRNYVSSPNPAAVLTMENSETYESFLYPDGGPDIEYECSWEDPEAYFILWNCTVDCKFVKEVSFRLPGDSDQGKIIKCGVHPIFHNEDDRESTHIEDKNQSTLVSRFLGTIMFCAKNVTTLMLDSTHSFNVMLLSSCVVLFLIGLALSWLSHMA